MRAKAVFALAAAVAFNPAVNAWGAVGHEAVATIAQIHLHPAALPKICQILNFTSTNPNVPLCHLAPIATWADKIRFKMRWSSTLHYVGAVGDHPPQTCEFPSARGWENKAHVLGAIRNDTEILEEWVANDRLASNVVYEDTLANEALKFLVHFVGDMHQPLHLTGRDRGGNSIKVLFDRRQSNLHSVWDGSLIAKAVREIPYNYTRPLPIPEIEYNLRGTIYDPWIRRIMWEGLYGRWKDEANDWLSCPQESEGYIPRFPAGSFTSSFTITNLWHTVQRLLNLDSSAGPLDDDIPCPYHWAKPLHALNCDLIWPKALDEPPYKHFQTQVADEDWVEGAFGNPHQFLELDTPDYAGIIAKDFVIEKLVAQGGIRLAGILNWLFASEADDAELRRKLRIVMKSMN